MATKLHPDYDVLFPYLEQISVCFAGERAVKAAGTKLLAMTSGQLAGGTKGAAAYEAYKSRAIYHNFPKETHRSMIGLMWRESPVIEIPEAFEDYMIQITPDGLGLEELLRKMNEAQLGDSRIGILIDVKTNSTSEDLPYVVTYAAKDIVNWFSKFENGEEILTAVVLDETSQQMNDAMEWEEVEQYRVLLLVDGKFVTYTCDSEEAISLTPPAEAIIPSFGGKTLDRIPFVFCNTSGIGTAVEIPPLVDLCDLSLALYRLEADYRQALFMQGQGTPTATGVSKTEMDNVMLGSTGLLVSDNPAAKFSFLELSGQGLPEMRQATDNLKKDCIRLGVSFIEQGQVESGVALETRMSSKTAILKTVALNGAHALQKVLEIIAEWTGKGDEVAVEPNLDFADDMAVASDFVSLMSAKTMGAPISLESIHAYAREKGFTAMTFEDEMELIAGEPAPKVPEMGNPPAEDTPPAEKDEPPADKTE